MPLTIKIVFLVLNVKSVGQLFFVVNILHDFEHKILTYLLNYLYSFKLFDVNQRVSHLENYEKTDNHWASKLKYYKELATQKDSNTECQKELYIEPLDWFSDRLEELNGKVK